MADTTARRVVLVGGGHSHALVLASLAARGAPHLRPTLVSPSRASIYSGMVPGLIAGRYQLPELQIDVAALAERAGAAFVQATVLRLDVERRIVELSDR